MNREHRVSTADGLGRYVLGRDGAASAELKPERLAPSDLNSPRGGDRRREGQTSAGRSPQAIVADGREHGRPVEDLDSYSLPAGATPDTELGPCMEDGIGDYLADEQRGRLDELLVTIGKNGPSHHPPGAAHARRHWRQNVERITRSRRHRGSLPRIAFRHPPVGERRSGDERRRDRFALAIPIRETQVASDDVGRDVCERPLGREGVGA